MNSKTFRSIVNNAVFLLIVLLSGSLSAQEEAIGTILMTKGSVEARAGDGSVRQLRRRSEIYAEDTIVTGAAGFAQMRLVDNAIVALKENTEFQFMDYSFDGEGGEADHAVMSLVRGGFRTIDGLIGQDSADEYRVVTQYASIGVRGTTHEGVIDNALNALFTGVYEGGTTVSNGQGSIDLGLGGNFDFSRTDDGQAPIGLLEIPEQLGNIAIIQNPNIDNEEDDGGDDGAASGDDGGDGGDGAAGGDDGGAAGDTGGDTGGDDGDQETFDALNDLADNPALGANSNPASNVDNAPGNTVAAAATSGNPSNTNSGDTQGNSSTNVDVQINPANNARSANALSGNNNAGGNGNGNSGNDNSNAGGNGNGNSGNDNSNAGGNGNGNSGNDNSNAGGNGNGNSGNDNSNAGGNGNGNSGSDDGSPGNSGNNGNSGSDDGSPGNSGNNGNSGSDDGSPGNSGNNGNSGSDDGSPGNSGNNGNSGSDDGSPGNSGNSGGGNSGGNNGGGNNSTDDGGTTDDGGSTPGNSGNNGNGGGNGNNSTDDGGTTDDGSTPGNSGNNGNGGGNGNNSTDDGSTDGSGDSGTTDDTKGNGKKDCILLCDENGSNGNSDNSGKGKGKNDGTDTTGDGTDGTTGGDGTDGTSGDGTDGTSGDGTDSSTSALAIKQAASGDQIAVSQDSVVLVVPADGENVADGLTSASVGDLTVDWGYWSLPGLLSGEHEFTSEEFSTVYLAVVDPANMDDLKSTSANWHYASVDGQFIGSGTAGQLTGLDVGFDVDLNSGSIGNGSFNASVGNGAETWSMNFTGTVNGANAVMGGFTDAVVINPAGVTQGIAGDLGGVFTTGGDTQGFVTGFSLTNGAGSSLGGLGLLEGTPR